MGQQQIGNDTRQRGAARSRPTVGGALATVMALLVGVLGMGAGMTTDAPGAAAAGSDRIPDDIWRARTDDYLAFATGQGLNAGSIASELAHAERAERDPSFTWDAGSVDPSDYEARFEQLRQYKDTGDFAINDYLFTLLRHGDQLRPDLATAFTERILAFKYWWTEPTPPGIIDSQYYWTENHYIIYLANEYIAGQQFPDEIFTNSGMTGREHMDHARPLLLRWMSLRARFGWSEWLSNVYLMEDLKGLLLLADWSEDPELTTWSSALLDVLMVELASHLQDGSFGATHGRTYLKDKMTARDEDTYAMAKMIFDDTPTGYENIDNASLLATARRYRPPEVARRIATSDQTAVVRQHQSLPLDPSGPITPDPVPPYGLAYDDALVWWGMSAQFPWQIIPLSIDLITTYDLLETDLFKDLSALKPIIENSTIPELQQLALNLGPAVNAPLLSEVNTYTWRSDDVMLSTAQDWRKGQRSDQGQISQATLGPDALVFTQHPAKDAPTTEAAARANTSFYWTGQGSAPRSVQHEQVNISMYAPQYASTPGTGIPYLEYLDVTHAFFPTEHFDEVVERDGWTIGRKGDGYVALWSWRPTEWRTYDPGTYTLGLTERFDLVAPGGADNVWITEVGRAADWAGNADPFTAFVDAITASAPAVTPLPGPGGGPHVAASGFDVDYASPRAGQLTTGWDAPLVVGGVEQPLADYPRMSSPWAEVGWDTWRFDIVLGDSSLHLDLSELARYTGADVPPPSTTTTTTSTPPTPSSDPPTTDPAAPTSGAGAPGGGSGPAAAPAQPLAAKPTFTG
jgi:hypothetical protein